MCLHRRWRSQSPAGQIQMPVWKFVKRVQVRSQFSTEAHDGPWSWNISGFARHEAPNHGLPALRCAMGSSFLHAFLTEQRRRREAWHCSIIFHQGISAHWCFIWKSTPSLYSLHLKINTILRSNMQTNAWCKIIKILIIFFRMIRTLSYLFLRRFRKLLFFIVVGSK